jgi:DNA-binding CsgD family transcriptional regulator
VTKPVATGIHVLRSGVSAAPKLLEREAEVTAIAAAVDRATRSGDRLTAVVAPAGMGKTRLLSEAARLASDAGFDVLYARGSELEQDFAFGLVRQLYEPTLVRMDPAERDVLLDGAASNATVAVLSNPSGGDDAHRDFSILHGLYWLTADLADRKPIALILDDLHWADTASLRFLAYLLPRLEGLAVPVFVALRPDVVTQGERLVNQVVTAAETTVLRPAPLSARASGQLVRSLLTAEAEPGFLNACHEATSGNPLLLRDLAVMVRAEGLDPTMGNAGMVSVLGPRAVEQRVMLWMDRLSPRCLALARAVAVLGDDSPITQAATLAELSIEDAFRAARDLERADLFRATGDTGSLDLARRLQFSHPLVRVTVYGGIDPADRVAAHRRAVDLLRQWRGSPEQVAPHLLRVPPAGDEDVVAILRRAADEAFAHGSPDTAATHLRRCLAEPPPTEQAAQVQWGLGRVMTLVDTNGAAQDLAVALRLATDPVWRAEIAVLLSTALTFLLRSEEAEKVCRDALTGLPAEEIDLRGKLEAGLLLIPLLQPHRGELAERRHEATALTEHDTVGSRELDCMLAAHAAWRSDPESVRLALRGLRAGVDKMIFPESAAAPCGWLVLIHADRDEALESIDSAVAQAHQQGSVHGLTTTLTLRGLAWLWRGQLAEAEADIRAGLRHADTARFELGHLMTHSFLADILMERGQLQEAETALAALGVPDPIPAEGPLLWYLDSRTRLLRRQGRFAEALDMALVVGRRFQAHGGDNPGFLAWRSEAALSAHQLGRTEQALALAEEDLRLATRWRAPRPLGRALRVMAVLRGGVSGIRMLRRAIEVLEPSPARLEHAAALLELGTLLRKDGQRGAARRHLAEAYDLATTCGAEPLRDRANAELRTAGGRPKYDAPLGATALTPSERRVVEFAATGRTNREIAQQLFVTVKTVEVHLTNAYRKLGVGQRDELAEALA